MNNNLNIEDVSTITLSLANLSFINQLHNHNVLGSEYYKEFKNIVLYNKELDVVGLGNPAMLLMMLYSVLSIPQQLAKQNKIDKKFGLEINRFIKEELKSLITTNINEKDYLRRIRNSISHYNVKFYKKRMVTYITFHDENYNNKENRNPIDISLLTADVGALLDKLIVELKKIIGDTIIIN